MASALVAPWPDTVRIAGEDVPVRTGWREGVAADMADMGTADGRLEALELYFGPASHVPDAVASDPVAALRAAVEWHDEGMSSCMPYGTPGRRGPSSERDVIDWDADAAIMAADFLRFYRIDLSDPSTDMHWYRFCSLLMALTRTEGSLVAQAVYARSPHDGARGPERKRLARLAKAWALPPTDAELREMARARF